jgi:hypothetical protein
MTPHWSRGDLEAGLDDLERFFTQLEEYRDLDAATLEAQIIVQLGVGCTNPIVLETSSL